MRTILEEYLRLKNSFDIAYQRKIDWLETNGHNTESEIIMELRLNVIEKQNEWLQFIYCYPTCLSIPIP